MGGAPRRVLAGDSDVAIFWKIETHEARRHEKDRPVRSRARDHQVRPVGWGALTVRVSRGADRYSSPFSRPRSRREPNWSLYAPLLYAPLLPLRESMKTLMS